MISNLTVTTEKRRKFLASTEEAFRTPEGHISKETDPIKAAVMGYETAEAIYEAQCLLMAHKLHLSRKCVQALLKVEGIKERLADDAVNGPAFISASLELMSMDLQEKEDLHQVAKGMGALQELFRSDDPKDQEKIQEMLKTLKKGEYSENGASAN
jgi:hypothetical protein